MDLLEWLQQKENATLILAMIGAVNGTLGLLISFLNRHDALGQAQREQAQQAPWAALRIEAGDHAGCLVRASFFNPSALAIVITQVRVEMPPGRQIVLMHPNPADLLGPPVPDLRSRSTSVTVNWTVRAAAETPERAAFHEAFIVADSRWAPETQQRWRPASRMRETMLAVRFTGHTLSAAQEPIDLLVRASTEMEAAPPQRRASIFARNPARQLPR